ncbi:MAG: hypothetical protein KBB83_05205 [Alphaproteobacteria bacterium]|nr:hypothetical protein [Alphaproteobacteria bacterium]
MIESKQSNNDENILIQEYADERTCSDGSCDLVMTTIHTNLTDLPHDAEFKTFLVKDRMGDVVKHLRALTKEDVLAALV